MIDKFGYLLKAEAEDHLIEEILDVKKSYNKYTSIIREACKWSAMLDKQNDILRSWGVYPQDEICKIRK